MAIKSVITCCMRLSSGYTCLALPDVLCVREWFQVAGNLNN